MAKKALQIGDRVRYTRTFLQAIGAFTGWLPQARGEVVGFIGRHPTNRLAVMRWENPSGDNDPQAVNVFNLERCRR